MERTMSVEEKIRRAEEIYARRQQGTQRKTATVSVNNIKEVVLDGDAMTQRGDYKIYFLNNSSINT